MFQTVASWMEDHQAIVIAVVLVSGLMAVGTAVAMPWVVAALPRDFFTTESRPITRLGERSSRLSAVLRFGRNMLGAVLVIAGTAMLVLPGQGLVTMVVGVMLLQFPGKWRMQRWIAQRRGVWHLLNWMRRKMGREPFEGGPRRRIGRAAQAR